MAAVQAAFVGLDGCRRRRRGQRSARAGSRRPPHGDGAGPIPHRPRRACRRDRISGRRAVSRQRDRVPAGGSGRQVDDVHLRRDHTRRPRRGTGRPRLRRLVRGDGRPSGRRPGARSGPPGRVRRLERLGRGQRTGHRRHGASVHPDAGAGGEDRVHRTGARRADARWCTRRAHRRSRRPQRPDGLRGIRAVIARRRTDRHSRFGAPRRSRRRRLRRRAPHATGRDPRGRRPTFGAGGGHRTGDAAGGRRPSARAVDPRWPRWPRHHRGARSTPRPPRPALGHRDVGPVVARSYPAPGHRRDRSTRRCHRGGRDRTRRRPGDVGVGHLPVRVRPPGRA